MRSCGSRALLGASYLQHHYRLTAGVGRSERCKKGIAVPHALYVPDDDIYVLALYQVVHSLAEANINFVAGGNPHPEFESEQCSRFDDLAGVAAALTHQP